MNSKFRSFEELLGEYLENPALADENIEAFKLSLKDIVRVHGNISHLAKKAQLIRGTLYNLKEGRGEIEIGTVLKLIHAPGYDLTVTRRSKTAC